MRRYLYNLATDKAKGFLPGLCKIFLFVLSAIYGAVIRLLILFYRINHRRLSCKSIGVGNITLGGTGKTVLVEFIAKYLREHGHKVAILTRGYRIRPARTEHRTPNTETISDEPYMLAKNLCDIPVIVDADRVRGARKAVNEYSADTVILDDAFQQWKIKKDLEIVTIDAANPFGNAQMIPRGILREPPSSLERADILLVTKADAAADTEKLKRRLADINPRALIAESIHKPVGFCELKNCKRIFSPDFFEGKSVMLFSGIGDPGSFENSCRSLGLKIGISLRFPDHFNYTQADFDRIIKIAQEKNLNVIVTTAKDAARLESLKLDAGGLQFLVLRIEIRLTKNEEEFLSRLLRL